MVRMVKSLLVRAGLRFAAEDAEEAFRRDYRAASHRQATLAASFAAIVFSVFGLWDYFAYDARFYHMLLAIRFGFAIPSLLLAIVVCQQPKLWRFFTPAIALACFAAGLTIIGQIHVLPNTVRVNDVSGLVLVIVFIYSNSRLRAVNASAVGWTICALYLIETNFLTFMEPFDRIMGGVMVVAANFLGGFSGYILERSARGEWLKAQRLEEEKSKTEDLLLKTLPEPVAIRLRDNFGGQIADSFDEATVLFADLVGFTEISGRVPATVIVDTLNRLFSRFDALTEKHGLEKIKTIGDAYMAVGGIPYPRLDHAEAILRLAIDMMHAAQGFTIAGEPIHLRIGIQSGPVVAGVIGRKRLIYDLWGDTVNTASRMEANGMPGEIHVAESTYQRVKGNFDFVCRGPQAIKGKGEMMTYFLKFPAQGAAPVRDKDDAA